MLSVNIVRLCMAELAKLQFTVRRAVISVCTACLTFAILRSAHTESLCVLCGSENKQRLFSYTTLTDRFYNTDLTL